MCRIKEEKQRREAEAKTAGVARNDQRTRMHWGAGRSGEEERQGEAGRAGSWEVGAAAR